MTDRERGQFVDNLAYLAQRYVEAVERGDKFAHARGLELAEAVLNRHEALTALDEPLRVLANELGDEARSLLMTAIDRLRSEGCIEGRRAMLQRLLELRFGSVAKELAQRVVSATEAQLDVWQERILSAESASAVLGDD